MNLINSGEPSAAGFHQPCTHNLVAVVGYQTVQPDAFERAFGHYRFVAFHRRQFPAFAYVVALRCYAFEAGYALSAPDYGFEYWFKFQYCVHFGSVLYFYFKRIPAGFGEILKI